MNNFICDLCDYKCYKQSDYTKHLLTTKHQNKINPKSRELLCKYCNKLYKVRNSLWYHEQKCSINDDQFNTDNINKEDINKADINKKNLNKEDLNKDLILQLIKEHSDLKKEHNELKNVMLKVLENGTHHHNNNNNTINSHNKSFNLNFFLNETCKNAMNITDFVDSIKLQLNDLIDVGEMGYVKGISKIIVNNLNNLHETERPIHCTDKKRDTFYIKDENKWEKDNEEQKIKNTIKKVVNKNIKILPLFKEKFPDYNESRSKYSDQYSKIIIEAMVCDKEKDDKIIKNISKATTIYK